MISSKKVKKAMKKIEKYCKENNLNGHHFNLKVFKNELNTYMQVKGADNGSGRPSQFYKNANT